MLITDIPICRDTTVRFFSLKPVCGRLDLPCLKTCQWRKSHWSKSWSHALLLPPLSLLYRSIPRSLTDRCHSSCRVMMARTRPWLFKEQGRRKQQVRGSSDESQKSTSYVPPPVTVPDLSNLFKLNIHRDYWHHQNVVRALGKSRWIDAKAWMYSAVINLCYVCGDESLRFWLNQMAKWPHVLLPVLHPCYLCHYPSSKSTLAIPNLPSILNYLIS